MTEYFLKNRISAIMLCASLLTAGIVSMFRLPVSLLPGVECPALSVVIEYPGVAPDKIESLITRPVERVIKTVNGISEIESVSEEGKSRINITFRSGTDIKIASVKVRGKIALVRDEFPREVQEPLVMRYDPSERPVIVVAAEMTGADRNGVREIMETRVKPVLQRIDGIAEIIIAGGELREIHIETDRSNIEGRGIAAADISGAVNSGNINLPAGTVAAAEGNSLLYIPSGYRSLSEISDTIINSSDGKSVRVNDLAVVRFGARERADYSRYNGMDMVTLFIHKGGDFNTLALCRDVRQALASFTDVRWNFIYDQGEHIESAVDNALRSAMWGIVIVILVLSFFFRRSETVLPVAISIPVSMLIVPMFLYLSGRGINIMTISGFALSAGMVVDNGIVVIDSIKRSADGSTGIAAAAGAVKLPVISSTFTTIAVFIPLMLISERTGETYGDMAFTITSALLVSLFFSLVLLPAFYLLIKCRSSIPEDKAVHNSGRLFGIVRFSEYLKSRLPLPVHARVELFYNSILSLEEKMFLFYKKTLFNAFNKSSRVLLLAVSAFFISLTIITFIEEDSVYDNGRGEFCLCLEFPSGTSLERTDEFVSVVEGMAGSVKGVLAVSVRTEKWRGTLTVKCDESLCSDEQKRIREELRCGADKIVRIAGGFAYINEADGTDAGGITVHFTGDDTETLKSIARAAASKINSIEGTGQCLLRFRDGRPEYTLVVDRDAAAVTGVQHAAIAESIRNSLFGPVITKFRGRGREIDVRVRMKESDRDSIEDLLSGSVKSESGLTVPLCGVVRAAETTCITKMFRLNGRRSCSITVSSGELPADAAEREISNILSNMDMPEGYSFQFDRRLRESRDELRNLLFAVTASVLLIYMILASLFESLTLPLVVMTTLPFAFTGVAPVLFVTGIPLSAAVYMGFIMLAGIVMNNGILLVESVRAVAVKESMSGSGYSEAVMAAAALRFRPVVITALSTIMGMLPMVISRGEGSSLWRPFAVTVSSGLLFSTVLTLVILPVVCDRYFKYRSGGDRCECKRKNSYIF
ncbi:MAG: efflux RND transporter permease subunit [Spirochaetes bacterium]|nr:efflux RND transporter permease subunit [Spirochaetota bacterium]